LATVVPTRFKQPDAIFLRKKRVLRQIGRESGLTGISQKERRLEAFISS
jgi:hypothetical protein